jgi:hypothetical protein
MPTMALIVVSGNRPPVDATDRDARLRGAAGVMRRRTQRDAFTPRGAPLTAVLAGRHRRVLRDKVSSGRRLSRL